MILNTALTCLALNIYHEARSEPLYSQVAVAQVTLNRVSNPNYPSTVCGVVTQKGQFSWYWDGLSDKPKEPLAWKRSVALADLILEANISVDCVDTTSSHTGVKCLRRHASWESIYFIKKEKHERRT